MILHNYLCQAWQLWNFTADARIMTLGQYSIYQYVRCTDFSVCAIWFPINTMKVNKAAIMESMSHINKHATWTSGWDFFDRSDLMRFHPAEPHVNGNVNPTIHLQIQSAETCPNRKPSSLILVEIKANYNNHMPKQPKQPNQRCDLLYAIPLSAGHAFSSDWL